MNAHIIQRLLSSSAGFSALTLRLPIAIIFMAHGAQKLFAWFGGYGLEGTGLWMDSIGLAPGYLMALLAGSVEFFGGIALLIGFLTRPAALVLSVTMVIAIVSVHLANGFFLTNNGYEYALALLAASVALMFSGAGRYSVDKLLTEK